MKNDYQQILGKLCKKMVDRHVEILRSIPYFTDWNTRDLKKLNAILVEVEFKHGNTVIKQNDQSNSAYIIKEGEFEILRLINYTP
jgi:CRP-like cAMP-binding protein